MAQLYLPNKVSIYEEGKKTSEKQNKSSSKHFISTCDFVVDEHRSNKNQSINDQLNIENNPSGEKNLIIYKALGDMAKAFMRGKFFKLNITERFDMMNKHWTKLLYYPKANLRNAKDDKLFLKVIYNSKQCEKPSFSNIQCKLTENKFFTWKGNVKGTNKSNITNLIDGRNPSKDISNTGTSRSFPHSHQEESSF